MLKTQTTATPDGKNYYAVRLARKLDHPNPKKAAKEYRQQHPDKITQLKNQTLETNTAPTVYAIPHQHIQHFTNWVTEHKKQNYPKTTRCPTCGQYVYVQATLPSGQSPI